MSAKRDFRRRERSEKRGNMLIEIFPICLRVCECEERFQKKGEEREERKHAD